MSLQACPKCGFGLIEALVESCPFCKVRKSLDPDLAKAVRENFDDLLMEKEWPKTVTLTSVKPTSTEQ